MPVLCKRQGGKGCDIRRGFHISGPADRLSPFSGQANHEAADKPGKWCQISVDRVRG